MTTTIISNEKDRITIIKKTEIWEIMSEIDHGAILYDKIIENLDDSYWNEDLDKINLTNRGYVLINGDWFTFGWHIGWGIVLATIEEMDHVPNITKAFYMKDSQSYKEYKRRQYFQSLEEEKG